MYFLPFRVFRCEIDARFAFLVSKVTYLGVGSFLSSLTLMIQIKIPLLCQRNQSKHLIAKISSPQDTKKKRKIGSLFSNHTKISKSKSVVFCFILKLCLVDMFKDRPPLFYLEKSGPTFRPAIMCISV